MKRLILSLMMLAALCSTAYAADCRQALFDPNIGIFAHEGGYQNSKYDTGNFRDGKNCGGTKYGIACKFYPKVDIKNLTKEAAAHIYERNQCQELRFAEFKGQKLPTLMLDMAVNMGTGTATRLVIKTVNRLNEDEKDIPLKIVMDEEVVEWVNQFTADKKNRSIFYLVLKEQAIDRYCDIVVSNPKQAVWLLGWIRRLIPEA